MDRNEIEELIEWHEAEASRLADRNIPNVNLDKHQRSADTLRHLLQAQTWRPIEEAPRDGTIIDLWHGKYGRLTDIWWDDGWVTGSEDEHITHWSPLPQPPSTDEEPKATPSEQQNEGEE